MPTLFIAMPKRVLCVTKSLFILSRLTRPPVLAAGGKIGLNLAALGNRIARIGILAPEIPLRKIISLMGVFHDPFVLRLDRLLSTAVSTDLWPTSGNDRAIDADPFSG
jgi:hypothetical protein